MRRDTPKRQVVKVERMYTIRFEDAIGKSQLARVMAPDEEAARRRAANRGATKIISVEITPPADKIRPLKATILTRMGG